MQWIKNYDLFLFDLDGLLVDTEKLHFEAYKRLCSRYGYELAWGFMSYLQVAHTSADGLRKALLPHLEGGHTWDHYYLEKKRLYHEILESGKLLGIGGVW